jgi:hypothetical protein
VIVRSWTKWIEINPEIADCYLNRHRYEYQRRPDPAHIIRLVRAMKNGEFEPDNIILASVQGDPKRQYLIDGQHRMHAIIDSGVTLQFPVEERVYDTLESLQAAYYRIGNGRPKTAIEGLPVKEMMERWEVAEYEMKRISAATLAIHQQFKGRATREDRAEERSPDLRFRLLEEWGPVAADYFAAISEAPTDMKSFMGMKGVLSVAMVTFRYSPDKAPSFWRKAAMNDRLEYGSPEHSLVRIVTRQSETAKRIRSHREGGREWAVMARMVASCWNYHFDGRQFSKLVMPDAGKPILIKGSPFKGR